MPGLYRCAEPGCGKLLSSRQRLSEHRSWHRGETQCPRCGKLFTTRRYMRVHEQQGLCVAREQPAPTREDEGMGDGGWAGRGWLGRGDVLS